MRKQEYLEEVIIINRSAGLYSTVTLRESIEWYKFRRVQIENLHKTACKQMEMN